MQKPQRLLLRQVSVMMLQAVQILSLIKGNSSEELNNHFPPNLLWLASCMECGYW